VALFSLITPPAAQPLVLAAALLSPAAAIGVVFGSPTMIGIAGILAAGALAGADRGRTAGVALGLTSFIVPTALFAVPVTFTGDPSRRRVRAAIAGAVVILGSLAMLVGGGHAAGAATEPGIGFANLLLYRGDAPGAASAALKLLALAALAAAALVPWRWRGDRWAQSALFLALGLFLTPGTTGHDVAMPLALLAVSAAVREASPNS
jgi:hypothetical protein